MAAKIISFVFVVLFVFLSKTQGLEDHKPLGNDIDKVLEKLKKAVDESVAKAQQALDEAKAKLNEAAVKTETAAAQAMQGTEDKLKEELDALKEKAKNAGVNIDDCLGENEQKLINLPNDFSTDMVQCVQSTLDEGIKYAQDALDKTEGLEDIIPVENEIGRLLIELRGVGDESLVEAQTTLDEAQAKLNEVAGKTETAAAEAIQGTENNLKGELNALKEKVKKAGVNIDDCLGENERKLNNLLIDFSRDMVQCVENTINEGTKYAQDALEKMKQTVDDAENIKQELNDCGHMWISETCLVKLAKKLEREVESLPTQIKADAVATASLISQLDKKIEKCASDKTDAWEAEGKILLKTIEICVARKIITRN